jgi:geranylgeranyl transferase type-2 subunit beta
MGLQMRTRQQSPATAPPSAIATSVSAAGVNAAQLSTPAHSTPSEPTLSENPGTPKGPAAMKKSKKELAKEAKEAKERQKAEEKQNAIDAARKKAEDAREKMKREQQQKAQKEADKKAAKAQAKKEKEQAKLNKKSAGKSKPTPAALVMPATPLKGHTKDLSAATPTTLPGTPATPAEPVRLLDTASLAGQSTIAKPSPLSAQPMSDTDQNNETPKNTPNVSQTPRREGVLTSNPSAQSPAISSVKSKRSFFGTLRRKFSSSPSPAASTRSMANGREGRSTPASGPSGAASLLSVRKPETISETPSTFVAQDKTHQSSETSSPAPQTQADAPPASAGVGIAEETVEGKERNTHSVTLATAAELPTANGGPDIPIDSTKEPVDASHDPVQEDGPEKPYLNGTLANQTEETLARMIDKAREGGLDVDLHVKYIQELDTVSSLQTPMFPVLIIAYHACPLKKTDELAYHMTEHLRINGVYWGLVALCLLNRPDALNREDMIKYVLTCWDEEAGK